MPDDATLQQSLASINSKLDMFMQHYRDRHEELEKRVDKAERRLDVIDDKINSLHNSSMQFVNDALAKQTEALNASTQGLERRILDRIEEKSRFSISQWVFVGIGLLGFVGTIIVVILK